MAWRPLRNIGLKLAALGLGTLLWFTVSGHQIERRLYVPVSYSNVPDRLELTDQMDGVSVYVRGDDKLVGTLREGDVRVVVGLENAQSGPNLIPLRPDDVVAPLGIEVVQIDPASASITLERSRRTSATVRPTIEGEPAAGLAVQAVTVTPDSVAVEGPESHLDGVVFVVTQRVVVTGRGGTFSQDVEVAVGDAALRVVGPRTVHVTVHIGPVPVVPPASVDQPTTPGGR